MGGTWILLDASILQAVHDEQLVDTVEFQAYAT